jgi:uncharacterized protein (TIGR04168 family)
MQMIIRIMGDPHGNLDLAEDCYWLGQADLALCTGDFAYHVNGQERDLARHMMAGLRKAKVYTILGNHDGVNHRPSLNYGPGEIEPSSQHEMIEALGECYVGYRRVDFENFSLVGGRGFSNGAPGIKYPPSGHEEITVKESAELILSLIEKSPNKDIILLTHNGPKGLGAERDSICGRDWRKPHVDWGDEDLPLALNKIPEDKNIMAVVMGHMHHQLSGPGYRQRMAFYKDIPVVNAAVVPRIIHKGVIVCRNFKGEIREKKVFQPHHHFMELECEGGQLKEVRDLWVCQGNRNSIGSKFSIWNDKTNA